MKINPRINRGFTLVELLVVIAIIATLAGVGVPVIIAQKKKGDRTEAINNAKQIGLAMFNFNDDYGSYPSDATAATLTTDGLNKINNTAAVLGTANSNDYFRQLLCVGAAEGEKMFYAKSSYTKKPDNNLTGSEALKAGEVAFGYVMQDATNPLSSSGNTGRALIVAALLDPSKTTPEFDSDVYEKKAVIYRIDNSAVAENIRSSDNLVTVGGGKTLFQAGNDTVWGTTAPTLKTPLKN